MKNTLVQVARELKRRCNTKKNRHRLMSAMSLIVAFSLIYTTVLPASVIDVIAGLRTPSNAEEVEDVEVYTSSDAVDAITKTASNALKNGPVLICDLPEHTHDEDCWGDDGFVCGLDEHTHDENCYEEYIPTEEEMEEINYIIELIGKLPTYEEIVEKLGEYEDDEDWEGYAEYFQSVADEAYLTYKAYMTLHPAFRPYVENRQRLFDLEAMWQASPLIEEITYSKPTVQASASTKDFIELNLYDYGSNINAKYNNDNKYPGFQWNGGAYVRGTYDRHYVDYIDFGNSMITDFTYGSPYSESNDPAPNKQSIGNLGGAINALDVSSYGVTNRPIGISLSSKVSDKSNDVLSRTLGSDGYPALKDGTSLSYLFKNGTYASKKNSSSIDGLFQQNTTSGAYFYNSRENHAQYSNNTFTLYNQIITPNFIVYPFGNFLPFNTITDKTTATQVGNIKSIGTYVQNVINDLFYSSDYQSNATKKQLVDMLARYRTSLGGINGTAFNNWSAKDAIYDYFKGNGDNPSDNTDPISTTLLNKMYNIDWDVKTNFFFGMEMKMNFIQPKGGMTGTDNAYPMRFEFTGDDDVWVYVDDVLFLDLSGIHRHVGGTIDFKEGKVYYYALVPEDEGDVNSTPYRTYTFADILKAAGKSTEDINSKGTFADYTTHKFNFYYMERGSGSSVCRLNFNFPLLKRNTISVEKELSNNADVIGNPDFEFQILKANEDGSKTNNLFIAANKEYTIYNVADDTKVGTGKTNSNGVFTLKAGQRAEFSGIKENAGKYYVRELFDSNDLAQYGTITVSGKATLKVNNVSVGSEVFTGVDSTVKDASDGSTVFSFNNKITTNQLGKLQITKQMGENQTADPNKTFKFEVWIDGTKQTDVVLKAGETKTYDKIIAGSTFTVKEIKPDGYTLSYSVINGSNVSESDGAVSGKINAAAIVKVIATNTIRGTEITIPVEKNLDGKDGNAHSFKFKLQQVTDKNGTTNVTGGTSQETTIDLSASETAKSDEDAFKIEYSELASSGTLAGKYYYKITEVVDSALEDVIEYDKSAYVVEVTVKSADTARGYTAAVTGLWKDGEAVTDNKVSFTNGLLEDLTIQKIVEAEDDNVAVNTDFRFKVTLQLDNNALTGEFEASKTNSQNVTSSEKITFTSETLESGSTVGTAEVTLKHGETIVIHGLPLSAEWKVSETNGNELGYFVANEIYKRSGEKDGKKESASMAGSTIIDHNKVIFYNNPSYELPATGGPGVGGYAMGGLVLMLAAVFLMYKKYRYGKEEHSFF